MSALRDYLRSLRSVLRFEPHGTGEMTLSGNGPYQVENWPAWAILKVSPYYVSRVDSSRTGGKVHFAGQTGRMLCRNNRDVYLLCVSNTLAGWCLIGAYALTRLLWRVNYAALGWLWRQGWLNAKQGEVMSWRKLQLRRKRPS